MENQNSAIRLYQVIKNETDEQTAHYAISALQDTIKEEVKIETNNAIKDAKIESIDLIGSFKSELVEKTNIVEFNLTHKINTVEVWLTDKITAIEVKLNTTDFKLTDKTTLWKSN